MKSLPKLRAEDVGGILIHLVAELAALLALLAVAVLLAWVLLLL